MIDELDTEVPPAELRQHCAGDVLGGKYRLERVIGVGGMGVVWVARNLALDADVALKLIDRGQATALSADRLLNEARAAARLGHPSIVRVFDFGRTALGDPYIAMELLTGSSLGALLDRDRRLPATDAVRLLLPIARALDFAHVHGVVHRDFKPDNIFLVTDDEGRTLPKLVDFGVARVVTPDSTQHRLTMAGTLLGSPTYMSPEQARGMTDIDQRTDVWAFGVVLYETITGKPPFAGANYNALLTSILADEPAPSTSLGAGDGPLWTIVARALTKDADARYPSMRELIVDLGQWLQGRGITTDVTGAPFSTTGPRSEPPALVASSLFSSPTLEAPTPVELQVVSSQRTVEDAVPSAPPPAGPRSRALRVAALVGATAFLVVAGFALSSRPAAPIAQRASTAADVSVAVEPLPVTPAPSDLPLDLAAPPLGAPATAEASDRPRARANEVRRPRAQAAASVPSGAAPASPARALPLIPAEPNF